MLQINSIDHRNFLTNAHHNTIWNIYIYIYTHTNERARKDTLSLFLHFYSAVVGVVVIGVALHIKLNVLFAKRKKNIVFSLRQIELDRNL